MISKSTMAISPPSSSAATSQTRLIFLIDRRRKILTMLLNSLRPPEPPEPPAGYTLPISTTVLHPSLTELLGCYSILVLGSPPGRSSLAGFVFTSKTPSIYSLSALHHRLFMPKISLDLHGTRSERLDSSRWLLLPSPGSVYLRTQSRECGSHFHIRSWMRPSSSPSPRSHGELIGPSNLSPVGQDPRSIKGGDDDCNPKFPSSFPAVARPEHSQPAVFHRSAIYPDLSLCNQQSWAWVSQKTGLFSPIKSFPSRPHKKPPPALIRLV